MVARIPALAIDVATTWLEAPRARAMFSSSGRYEVGARTNLERLAGEQEAKPRVVSSPFGMGVPPQCATALWRRRCLAPQITIGCGTTEAVRRAYLRQST